jgi:putative copper export protein
MAALLKTALLLGLVLFLGGGVFSRFIAPSGLERRSFRRLRIAHLVGAVVLVAAGLGDVAWLLYKLLGVLDAGLLVDFLTSARQGTAVLARVGLTVVVVAIGLGRRRARAVDRVVFVVAALALLFTVSRVSHSGALGLLPTIADLAHLIAATVWGGSLLYAAWLPLWGGGAAAPAALLGRLSTVGLYGVGLLVASGIYVSTLHLFGIEAFVETAYGGTLAWKIGLVLIILVLAAVNRWFLLPAVKSTSDDDRTPALDLSRVMRVESLVLIGVFAVTGLLGSRVPATAVDHLDHGSTGLTDAHDDHDGEFDVRLSGPIVVQLASDPETALALLVVRLRLGGEPVEGATVRLLENADPGASARVLIALPGVPGSYGTPEFAAPEFGEWTVTVGVEFPDGRRVVEEMPVLPFGAAPPP